MPHTTRRELLRGGALLLAASQFPAVARAQASHIRPDIRSANGRQMLAKYARAVGIMQSSAIPPSDSRSWTYQWYIHAVPARVDGQPAGKSRELDRIFGATGPGRDLAEEVWWTCQAHFAGSSPEMFLPWHRMYLAVFENIIRDVLQDDDFALPYWDYTKSGQRSIPAEFRNRTHNLFKHLYVEERKNDGRININAGDPMDRGATQSPFNLSVMQNPEYAGPFGFCESLDGALHGNVHTGVGGAENMGRIPTAARDPAFWVHHCNIDRIWAGWNAAGGRNPNTSALFAFAGPSQQRIEMDARDVGTTASLGYGYDDLPVPPRAPSVSGSVAGTSPATIAISEPDIGLGAGPTEVQLDTPPATEIAASTALAGTNRRLLLVLEGLAARVVPDVLYEAFLNLPRGANDEQKRKSYVGTFSFFRAGEHDGHPSGSLSFDITETVRTLREARQLGSRTSVTFIPIGAPAAGSRAIVGRVRLVSR